jgi:hypothetical protein
MDVLRLQNGTSAPALHPPGTIDPARFVAQPAARKQGGNHARRGSRRSGWIFEMNLARVRDTNWPAGDPVPAH